MIHKPPLKSRDFTKRTVLLYMFSVMLFVAISNSMTGVLVPILLRNYHLSYGQIGSVSFASGVGSVAAMLIGGIVSDRLPKVPQIAASFFIYADILIFLGTSPVFMLILTLYFLMGFFGNYINLLVSARIPESFSEKSSRYLNIGHAFFSIGSILGPLYTSLVLQLEDNWGKPYWYLGIIYLLINLTFLFACCAYYKNRPSQGEMIVPKGQFLPWRIFLNPQIWLLILMNTVDGGFQGTISLWAVSYCQNEIGIKGWLSAGTLTLFWIGVAAGRITQSLLYKKISSSTWLLGSSIASSLLLFFALRMKNGIVFIAILCLCGFLLGATYPSLISLACGCYPQNTGTVTTAVCFGSALGASIIPWIVGNITEAANFTAGMQLIPALLLLYAGAMALWKKSNRQSDATI